MKNIAQRYKSIVFSFIVMVFTTYAYAELIIEDAWVRAMPPGQSVAVGFLSLVNTGDEAITIVGAQSDSAEQTEIHQHRHHNGMMRMEKVEQLIVPAGETVILAPGGYHLMLMDTKSALKVGDSVLFELQTSRGDKISTTANVRRSF